MLVPIAINRKEGSKTCYLLIYFVLLNLVLCNFWVFPNIKKTMKNKHFKSIQNLEAAMPVSAKDSKENFQE